MAITPPQSGHWTRLPAASSRTFSCLLQEPQVIVMLMIVDPSNEK